MGGHLLACCTLAFALLAVAEGVCKPSAFSQPVSLFVEASQTGSSAVVPFCLSASPALVSVNRGLLV